MMLFLRVPISVPQKLFCLFRWIIGALASATGVVPKEDHEDVNGRMGRRPDDLMKSEPLPHGLRRELMPRHVAVIIDCNGRRACHWGLPGSSGHEAGIRPLRELVELCGKWGIKVLTLLAFSSGNWSRSKEEVDFLMDLLERLLQSGLEIMFERRHADIHDRRLIKTSQVIATNID
ncbi:dehydrodolichyl diphosphate synthase 2-like [Punica granatum]|uniref:Dehydrodolichyl diphosphate synthase 2-like n=1 Tax=Punica granatum TaxID=22663 RepID=A0A6P8BVS2_PUNGR|nr:dehydrodolichyl diphosphate synthase 2-like [Punica granatum]